jgi:hypothetical protein
MITRGWGVLPIRLVRSKQQGLAPIPGRGDHQGLPYRNIRPLFMASVDAYEMTSKVSPTDAEEQGES